MYLHVPHLFELKHLVPRPNFEGDQRTNTYTIGAVHEEDLKEWEQWVQDIKHLKIHVLPKSFHTKYW